MTDNKYEIKNNEGTLWTTGLQILCRGTINRNNQEGYVALVSHNDKEGKPIYELMKSCGVVYFNTPPDKHGDHSPDYSGTITLDGIAKASLWENVSQRGTKYFNIKFKDKEDTDSPF